MPSTTTSENMRPVYIQPTIDRATLVMMIDELKEEFEIVKGALATLQASLDKLTNTKKG